MILLLKKHRFVIFLSIISIIATYFWQPVIVASAMYVGSAILADFISPTYSLFSKRFRMEFKLDSFGSYIAHVKSWLKFDSQRPRTGIWIPKPLVVLLPYVVPLLASILFCGFLGLGVARMLTRFPFIGDSGEVILRRYGDTFVFGRYDPESGELLADFRLIKADDLKERIVMRDIGAISPVQLRRQDVRKIKKPADEPKATPSPRVNAATP